MKKIHFLTLFLSTFLIFSCGFKVENFSKLTNFGISNVETVGDQRINYKIKSSLLLKTKQSDGPLINVNLITKKTKSIKEKNIKNEVTKYNLNIIVNVSFNKLGESKGDSFSVSKSLEYVVANRHSTTRDNENKSLEILSEKISQEIFEKLITQVDDL